MEVLDEPEDVSPVLPSGSTTARTIASEDNLDVDPVEISPSDPARGAVATTMSTDVDGETRTASPATEPMNTGIVDESTIRQIVHFWNHPSLEQVSPSQKQAYLRHKGFTDEQVFSAWDRLMESQHQANGNAVSPFTSQQPSKPQYSSLPPTSTLPHEQSHPIVGSYDVNNNISSNNNIDSHYMYAPKFEEEEEDGSFSAPNVALIATVGGFLGLIVAATVRWLNGGDFLLLPPPSRITDTTKGRVLTLNQPSLPLDSTILEEDEDKEEADENAEDGGIAELAQYLSSPSFIPPVPLPSSAETVQRSIMKLTETFQQHVIVQERILQKLANRNNNNNNSANITDMSMQALRNHQQRQQGTKIDVENNTLPDPMLWYKLVEIQVELATLQRGWSQKEMTQELEKLVGDTLQRLQVVLDSLKPDCPTNNEQIRVPEKKVTDTDKASESTVTLSTPSLTTSTTRTDDSDPIIPEKATAQSPCSEDDTQNETLTSPAAAETTASIPAAEGEETHQILRAIRIAIIDLVRQNADNLVSLKEGTQVLYLYVSNLSKHPQLPRFRKVFTSNPSFKKVEQLQGGLPFLAAIGFVMSSDKRLLEWPPAPEGDVELTSEDKESLARTYHLSEVAEALAMVTSVEANEGADADKAAAISLLEKALGALPCPPPM